MIDLPFNRGVLVHRSRGYGGEGFSETLVPQGFTQISTGLADTETNDTKPMK